MLTSTPVFVEPTVLVLARALRDRGLRADPQLLSVCGEPDVRLVICRPGEEVAVEEVAVEVLAALAGERPADRWQAVRVRGVERHVWLGPPHDDPLGDAVAFVEALLEPYADGLPYLRLG